MTEDNVTMCIITGRYRLGSNRYVITGCYTEYYVFCGLQYTVGNLPYKTSPKCSK